MKILIGGDVMFGRYSMEGEEYIDYNELNPLNDLNLLRSDITIVNLENPLCHGEQEKREKKGVFLRGTPNSVNGLLNGGVDIVSFANNHSGDFSFGGIKETLEILKNNRIGYAGAEIKDSPFKPYIDDEKKLLFFAITTIDSGSKTYVANVLTKESRDSYVLYVKRYREMYPEYKIINSIHWGVEYKLKPELWQSRFAKDLIDIGGSDIIMGHGPHVRQRYGIYKDKLIMYSLGNLYFVHSKEEYRRNPSTHKGSLLLIELNGREIKNIEEKAVWITQNKSSLIVR
jgi:poly-gamma-glutamate capsule biosynthesis protein CapA/YwtB (metallophosphatase superfamily)